MYREREQIDVAGVARHHLEGLRKFHIAPDVPPRKLAKVRKIHRYHLPSDEPVVVLYDDTLFGGAKDGFVATESRLCWKNIGYDPVMVEWGTVNPGTIVAEQRRVLIANGEISLASADDEASQHVARFFRRVVSLFRETPNPSELISPIASTDEVARLEAKILERARCVLAGLQDISFAPYISTKKEANFRRVCDIVLPPDERLLVLYDANVFGSAKEGFGITSQALYWRNTLDDPQRLALKSLDSAFISGEDDNIVLGAHEIWVESGTGIGPQTSRLLLELMELATASEPGQGDSMQMSGKSTSDAPQWRCDSCNGLVDANAVRCPHCGAFVLARHV